MHYTFTKYPKEPRLSFIASFKTKEDKQRFLKNEETKGFSWEDGEVSESMPDDHPWIKESVEAGLDWLEHEYLATKGAEDLVKVRILPVGEWLEHTGQD